MLQFSFLLCVLLLLDYSSPTPDILEVGLDYCYTPGAVLEGEKVERQQIEWRAGDAGRGDLGRVLANVGERAPDHLWDGLF